MRRISLGRPAETAPEPPSRDAAGRHDGETTGGQVTPTAPDARPRRRTAWRVVLYPLALLAIFAIGWLGSALWFSPAPLLPEERTVPRVLGLPLDDARTTAGRAELRVRAEDRRPHPTAPPGVVIWQDPAPGTAVPMNTIVHVATSAGRPAVPVPDLTGLAARDAAAVLEAGGLAVGEVDTVAAAGEAGVVLGTRPGVGTARTLGARVDLIVTAGDPPAERSIR